MPPGKMPGATRHSRRGSHKPAGRRREFAELPGEALRAASYAAWSKSLQAHLYETARANVLSAMCSSSHRKPANPRASSVRA